MGSRRRLIFTLVVLGLVGTGLATAPPGQAASPAALREGVLSAELRCRSVPRDIDFTGAVRIVASLPDSVVPGARFTIRPEVTLTVDPTANATPATVVLLAPVPYGGGVATVNLPTTATTAITLDAGVTGPVTLMFAAFTMATVRLPDGTTVDCYATSSTGELSVPVIPPTDGSQQTFDVRATATCTDESRTFTHEFGMRGVAPARVATGESVSITFDWKGLSSMLQDRGTIAVTGVWGRPEWLGFTGVNGSWGIRTGSSPAGPSGQVRFELEKVESALQAMDPPHVNTARCTFPDGGPVITVPITGAPAVTTSTSTTTTTTTTKSPGSSLIKLIKALLCTIFRVC